MTSSRMARAALLVVALGAAGLIAGCGLSEDGSPRVISDEALPPDLTDRPDATTTIPPELAEEREIFLVSQQADDTYRLVPRPRQVRADADTETKAKASLQALVRRTDTDDRSVGSNFVPETVVIQSVDLADKTLTIDLSADMANVDGQFQRLAYAQLVFTATQFDGIDMVRFTINGQVSNAVDGTGEAVPVVTRASYANFAPVGG